MAGNLVEPGEGREVIEITPDSARWERLGYTVFALGPGQAVDLDTGGRESAIVTISGAGIAEVEEESIELARRDVFEEMAGVLYVPPGPTTRLVASSHSNWSVAVGSAPADGRYPVRLIEPAEVEVEIRGGGAALRQVNHLLAPPLPAERLIVFEVYVPGGSWAGWPAHRHDGEYGSPYLEETYYFRFDRSEGFGFHRNYGGDHTYDETFTVHDGDCVAVPRGYHVTTAAPGYNMWILNFLAGELIGDERSTPPYFDPATTWVADDWSQTQTPLPIVQPTGPVSGGRG